MNTHFLHKQTSSIVQYAAFTSHYLQQAWIFCGPKPKQHIPVHYIGRFYRVSEKTTQKLYRNLHCKHHLLSYPVCILRKQQVIPTNRVHLEHLSSSSQLAEMMRE